MWEIAKYHKNEFKSGVYSSVFEFSSWPEMHFKPLSSSRRGKLMVCALDHSGSQPFI